MIAALLDLLTSPDLHYERWLLAGSIVSLLVLGYLIIERLNALRVLGRWARREIPHVTVTIQPSSPARPLTLPAAKGFHGPNMRVFVRPFGFTQREWEHLAQRERRIVVPGPWAGGKDAA